MRNSLLLRLTTGLLLFEPFLFTTRAGEFPVQGILPKQETGATRLLKKYSQHDGRGVVVAIFDTGVDPGATGLQVTSDGKPKIVDLVDGSGSGDVDTSTVRELDGEAIEGLSGRKLTIPKQWRQKNATAKYHVGIKRAYELFPARLIPRLKEKRKEKWDASQRNLVARLQERIAKWEVDHPKPSAEQKKVREDLQARLDQLRDLEQSYDDPGPIYDCVVFKDGDVWRAAVDTDEDGKLADETLLTNFRLEREYATFGEEDLLNFAVNVYEDGNLLSIVTDCGAHGTHVAGIVAGNYPDQPELSGLAPGAQIVSVKIGDRRLGSSSTGTGEMRGLITVLQNKCDLINMSYGGSTTDPNHGRITDFYSEIVNKHGVIFVVSAGNNGPALSTVGSPGGTTSAIIGVGAYVSPAMMQAEYSLRKKLPETPYTWSSRGPTFDGDLGVDICAPGGAIAPVPNWVLQPNMMMNGTSMSSPNACGAIALIISGLKSEEIRYSPHSVRRALENTARPLHSSEVFAHGRGLIQVDKAFDYLKENVMANGELLRFEVDLPRRNDSRGIYLREPHETDRLVETRVRIQPKWHDDADNREQVDFQMRVGLESTAEWVHAPGHVLLVSGGKQFEVEVDPTQLDGGVHFAEVLGFDESNRERGPLFRLPISVIRPTSPSDDESPVWRKKLKLRPGKLDRTFIAVPAGATWADLTIRAEDTQTSRLVVVHCVQALPKQSFRDAELKQFIRVEPKGQQVRSFPVVGGGTLEVCLGQYWSSLGDGRYDFELEFHGVVPSDPDLRIDGSRLSDRVDIATPLRMESVAPSASLKTLQGSIRPSTTTIRPLTKERDRFADERQFYEIILEYKFDLDEEAEVTPVVALSRHQESWLSWQSRLWQIFDSGKQLKANSEGDRTVKLSKGEYTIRYHARHDQVKQLEMLKDMPLALKQKLPKSISVGIYADPDDLVEGGSKFGTKTLKRGERTTLFFETPKTFPKNAKPGDLLLGTVTYGKTDEALTGSGKRPDGFDISYVIPPAKVNDSNDKDESKEKKTLKEKLRDTKVAHLSELRSRKERKAFDKLAAKLLKSSPNDLFILIEQLKFLDDDNDKRKEHLPEIVGQCDKIIAEIDQEQLAAHYGIQLNEDDKKAKTLRKEMDRKKSILTDALYRKGRALAYMDLPSKYSKPDEPPVKKFPKSKKERNKLFEATFAELEKWVDLKEPKYVLLHIRRERRLQRQGNALEALNDHIEESKPTKLLFKKRGDLYDELGWDHWRDYERKWMILRFPAGYPPF